MIASMNRSIISSKILGKVFKQCPVFLVSALGTLTPIEAVRPWPRPKNTAMS